MKIAKLINTPNILLLLSSIILGSVFYWVSNSSKLDHKLAKTEWYSKVSVTIDYLPEKGGETEKLDVLVNNKYEFLDNHIFIRSSVIDVPEKETSVNLVAIGHWKTENEYLLFDKIHYHDEDKLDKKVDQVEKFIFHTSQGWHIRDLTNDSLLVETVGNRGMVLSKCLDECIDLSNALDSSKYLAHQ